ncbi:hypothetical protein [Pseudoduganella albidiflava]|uniref:hypothetical protein n=1 Tax=Pseudoduganella albidiflava TaxID=321983 RepID=UPI0013F16523|nr:hypothetical protein [Pseudoduganella albidiflava]
MASKIGQFLLNSTHPAIISSEKSVFSGKSPKAFRTDTVTWNNSGLIVTGTAWRAKVTEQIAQRQHRLESHHGIGHQHQHLVPEFAT